VEAFLQERIGFLDITDIIESALAAHDGMDVTSLDVVREADAWARRITTDLITAKQR
jgi:1-deoxy-D-xylulose 5-phosphate reductoisomerase